MRGCFFQPAFTPCITIWSSWAAWRCTTSTFWCIAICRHMLSSRSRSSILYITSSTRWNPTVFPASVPAESSNNYCRGANVMGGRRGRRLGVGTSVSVPWVPPPRGSSKGKNLLSRGQALFVFARHDEGQQLSFLKGGGASAFKTRCEHY